MTAHQRKEEAITISEPTGNNAFENPPADAQPPTCCTHRGSRRLHRWREQATLSMMQAVCTAAFGAVASAISVWLQHL
ncbi:hypothetical protein AB0F96_37100 [Streptomyces sp. NPDC023998]|uniref:hypothetical protein n=1 Tax=Streptomyces sp. NPDC023998 TaxID=3154597 RepID=UPI0033E3FA8B